MSSKCVLCDKNLKNSKRTNVTADGLKNLIELSSNRGDTFVNQIFRSANSIQLHLSCRNKYVSKINFSGTTLKNDCDEETTEEETTEEASRMDILDRPDIYAPFDEVLLNVGESLTNDRNSAFEKTCTFMQQTDECQFKIEELQAKMQTFLITSQEPYCSRYFLDKLMEKFGQDIIITKGNGTENFICFRGELNKVIASKISPLQSDEDILLAAAQILNRKIKSVVYNTDEYPSFDEISTGGVNSIPPELQMFMNRLVMPKKPSTSHKNKSLAIQNAIVSLIRPRFISPLLLGIGTLIHRRTNSRYINDILHAYGFSSSYQEVLRMQKCAAMEPQRKKLDSAYIQHSWDNADINTRTLNGHGTWHSLGGLECVTPSKCSIVTGNLKRLKDVISAKEIGAFGSLPIKPYFKPKKSGLSDVKVESVVLAENKDKTRYYISTDFLWLCGRLFDFDFAPSWFGYNAHIYNEVSGFATTKTTPLPFINLDPGNLSTIKTALSFTASQCKQLNQEIGFVTFDGPLYIKAVGIVKSADLSSDISKLVIRLGGFHLLMSFLGTIGYIMNGSGIEDLYNTVYAKNTVVHMLSGHAYSRSVRGCLLAQEAISHLILKNQVAFSYEEKSYLQNVFETFQASTEEELNDPLLERIQSVLTTQFNQFKVQSRTARLWIQYWDMIQIVKNYIKAERIGDLDTHLLCVSKMIPYFHAAGRLQYAKYAQIYLQDMLGLETRMMPEEFKKFVTESFFTIRRTSKFFSGSWTDQVIEQDLMRAIKVSGGLNHGRGTTDNSLAVWMGALPHCMEVINSVEKFTGKCFITSEQHVELRTSREKIDRDDLNKFKEWLIAHNPFDESKTELYSISTGVVAASMINCEQAEKVGLACIAKIIGQNFEELKLSTETKVKPLGFSMKAIKLKGQEVIINPHQLFHRILTVMPSEEMLRESFFYELASYPLSLFDDAGIRQQDSSCLFNYFDKMKGQIHIDFSQNDSEFFVSGESILWKVTWNSTQTFGEIIDQYVKYILYHYGRTNVNIFFNGPIYDLPGQTPILGSKEIFFENHIKVSAKQSQVLSNEKNKLRIADNLIRKLNQENIRAHQAENKGDRLMVKAAVTAAKEHGNKNVVVVSEEQNVLALLIDKSMSTNVYMLRPGKKITKTSCISNIQKEIGIARNIILAIHAISGNFYKKGKVIFLKKVMTNPDIATALEIFNQPNVDVGKLFDAGEKLLLSVYGATKATKGINSLRYELFSKINRKKKLNQEFQLACLPPTRLAAEQQLLRAYFQVQEWKFNILNPADWGWALQDGVWMPIKTLESMAAPNWVLESIFCNCQNGCTTTLCTCKKFKLSCSEACGYCHSECTNRTIIDYLDDDRE